MEIIGVISGIIGILGGIFTLISFIKNRKNRKLPTYAQTSRCVASSDMLLPELKITFQGKEIETLTVTTIAFWNNGKKPLKKDDYPFGNPPCVIIQNKPIILKYELLESYDNDFIDLQPLELKDNTIPLCYNSIRHKEGFAIRVFHTGTPFDIYLSGKFEEYQIKKVWLLNKPKNDIIYRMIFAMIWFFATMTTLFFSAFCIYSFVIGSTSIEKVIGFVFCFLACLYSFYIYIIQNFVPLRNLPKRFHQFFNQFDDK